MSATASSLFLMVWVDFAMGEVVYLKTDPDQLPRIVTGIDIRPGGSAGWRYQLGGAVTESYHYAMEITREKKI